MTDIVEIVPPEEADDSPAPPEVIAVLGELKPGAVITEEGVAAMFRRHLASVKRAVQRGELPHPCQLFGQNAWTAGALVRHIETRLEEAASRAAEVSRRIEDLSP